MKICVMTDNEQSYQGFSRLIQADCYKDEQFYFYCSPENRSLLKTYASAGMEAVDLKERDDFFFSQYDLFISLHCRQIFPGNLVRRYRCINVHPGYNPYNRGWYPQVFSILNGAPVGVTIHKMDDLLDHGPILFQEQVEICETDTSYEVYQRIQAKEMELLSKYLPQILRGEYTEHAACAEGSFHYKKDFEQLCKINLEETATYREMIDRLRATSFKGYQNAYFIAENGSKIYIRIELTQ